MAKPSHAHLPSSARPPSRQSQEGTTAARTTRSTRSQSREPVEQPVPSAVPKKEKKTKKAPALNTVDEDVPIEDQLTTEMEAAEEAAVIGEQEGEDLARRISNHSGMSGTTAKTSFSQEEIGELDADVMVDVLPNLSYAADELAKLLVPNDEKFRPTVRKEIRTSGSKYNKLFKNRISALNIHKQSFGSTEYIQPSIVLRALFGVQTMRDVPPGPWRPDPIIYRINLAQMLRSALISVFDNAEISIEGYNAIQNLDTHFASAIAGPEFDPSAFHLALSLLTQLAIIRSAVNMTDHRFNARETITSTFYMVDDDGDKLFRHRNVLHMMNLAEEEQTSYSQIIQQVNDSLIHVFDTAGSIAALGALRAEYPWEGFVDAIIKYYLDRKKQLDEEIEVLGGIDQIKVALATEVERRAEAKMVDSKRKSFARPSGTPKKSFGKADIKTLKARERQLKANAAPAAATAPVAQMVELPDIQPDLNTAAATAPQDDGFNRMDEDEPQPARPVSQAQSTARNTLDALAIYNATQGQVASKGKGRSFNDRQPGAEKINFDDEGSQLTQYQVPDNFQYPASSAPVQAPYFQAMPRGHKRGHVEEVEAEDFEPTQDGGFEVDTRDMEAADQRRRNAPQVAREPQPRFTSNVGPVMPVSSTSPSPSKRQRKNPGSSIPSMRAPFDPEEERPLSTAEQYQRARMTARHGTLMANAVREPQVRKPWTPAEESALIDLIERESEFGIQYAKLKGIDEMLDEPRLSNRSAEDLRFKARNMKETFLKGRCELPRNFQFIVLDKKAIRKLESLGIGYEQEAIRARKTAEVEIEMQ